MVSRGSGEAMGVSLGGVKEGDRAHHYSEARTHSPRTTTPETGQRRSDIDLVERY